MKLHLGFESFPYSVRYQAKSPSQLAKQSKRPSRRWTPSQKAYGQGKTTLEVAEELEEKYHIVETFYDMEEDFISELVGDAYIDALDDIEQFTKRGKKIKVKQTDRIATRFRQNLSRKRYDGVISGVPTLAAQRGVSHLYQKPYAKRSPRPSFIDTGMYQGSFKAWVEDD